MDFNCNIVKLSNIFNYYFLINDIVSNNVLLLKSEILANFIKIKSIPFLISTHFANSDYQIP